MGHVWHIFKKMKAKLTLYTYSRDHSFQGSDMDGVAISDYAVDIGLGTCVVNDVTSRSLSCTPPEVAPEKPANDTTVYYLVVVSLSS